MRELELTSRYKKDYRLAARRGCDLGKLDAVIDHLLGGAKLPPELKDHSLGGGYSGHRECHIEPDWLLIYRVSDDESMLTAVRTGSHSDLFG
ncbi:MAG: type II toxin-antitoxin system YafQ family toxin [Bifidobacteriaceae bacterium]|jgi:mRNA interferase YafQ|nr:type II toxin-antitoxin system YafQ family toxin [Bifidobacteriaceae bacterium]